jgi:hypothetical protein
MNYFDPHGESISVFDVCHAYQLLEANYSHGGWLRERPSNKRRMESIGCQLGRLGYSDVYRTVDLWADEEEVSDELETSSDNESVRYVYFKKVLEWGLPLDDDDRAVIDRTFTIEAIERWRPDYFRMRPWRAVVRPDYCPGDLDMPVWQVHLPDNATDIKAVLCDGNGPINFHSYSEATQKAKSLTEEMNARNQGAGAQDAQRPGA